MKHLFVFIVLSLLNFSCRKQNIVCTGNCSVINSTGYIINKLTNAKVGNVPITLDWVTSRIFLCAQKNVYSGKSNANGTFNFTSSIDTSRFKEYRLKLRIEDNPDFISLPERGFNLNQYLYSYNINGLQNVIFEVYPKANLKIKLNRTSTDQFTYFSVVHSFVDNAQYSDFSVLSPQEINKTEVNVFTAADIYTKVIITKTLANGTSTYLVDSLKCNKGPNTYVVTF